MLSYKKLIRIIFNFEWSNEQLYNDVLLFIFCVVRDKYKK